MQSFQPLHQSIEDIFLSLTSMAGEAGEAGLLHAICHVEGGHGEFPPMNPHVMRAW